MRWGCQRNNQRSPKTLLFVFRRFTCLPAAFLSVWGGQRFQRCHLIAIFLPVHGLQRHRITGLQIGQLAKVPLVIMSRNDQIFRICTAGIAADSIRCLFIANSHYNCRGEPYSSSLQWLDLFSELLFAELRPKTACHAQRGDHQ